MKKLYFLLISLLVINITDAQITLEHSYDNTGYWYSTSGANRSFLFMVELESSGIKYVNINRVNEEITFYNLNHSLYKSIFYPNDTLDGFPEFMYISEHLFDLDDEIEYLYSNSYMLQIGYTKVYNEDGTELFSEDHLFAHVHLTVHMQQYPIYNTPNGTKLILSHQNGTARVYSLPGTLSIATSKSNEQILQNTNYGNINIFPNPTSYSAKVEYELPQGENNGEIIFYNLQGVEIKRFKVDNTFDHLLITTSELSSGTYLYHLVTKNNKTKTKKMIIIK